MNYIGSKKKLSTFIISNIEQRVDHLEDKVFADLFAGTGIISRKLKGRVKKIIANDIEHYSFVLLKNYIWNHSKIDFEHYLETLENIDGVEGFIFKNYCFGGGSGRQFFSDENGKKIDAVRIQIANWFNAKEIDQSLYYFLLTSLLEASDKVANTASVYGAFLKRLKRTARQNLQLKPPLFDENSNNHDVFNTDANKLIKNISGDILYLDPPYNHRQYGANYHLLNTISLYDNFIPKGKTGLRDYYRSGYCIKNEAEDRFEDLIKNADFSHIFLSYNNEGIISFKRVKEIMSMYGKYSVVENNNYQRFKADRDCNRKYKAEKTIEYLHILIK